jgi:transposase
MYTVRVWLDDEWMAESELSGGLTAIRRRRRSAEERRRIVEETLEAGSSVARVARKYGINANQVFMWRRLYRSGLLGNESTDGLKLLPVSVSDGEADHSQCQSGSAPAGAIHIELPKGARVSLEGSVDPAVVRAVLESLRS